MATALEHDEKHKRPTFAATSNRLYSSKLDLRKPVSTQRRLDDVDDDAHQDGASC